VKALVRLSNANKRIVCSALKERYRYPEVAVDLAEERTFLQQVREGLAIEIQTRRGTVAGYLLEQGALRTVDDAVAALDKPSGSPIKD